MQLRILATLALLPATICVVAMPTYETHASPPAIYVVRSAPQPMELTDTHVELLRRLLLSRSGNDPDKIKEALEKAKKAGSGESVHDLVGRLRESYNKAAAEAAQGSSRHTGSVSKTDKNAPPHRDGKPSSTGGPASSSGRHHH
ncbi:hypothetical protein OC842_003443 [Tilletia horrida]|uniref:Uncharacterized protein n=1 Tax=Tilletia horrida TaxID=155126 RepID=A0AAN6GG31_9BASI|nr:hypothetical protein OC842_003443 [Tilletia horrida]